MNPINIMNSMINVSQTNPGIAHDHNVRILERQQFLELHDHNTRILLEQQRVQQEQLQQMQLQHLHNHHHF